MMAFCFPEELSVDCSGGLVVVVCNDAAIACNLAAIV
jgi:hypothetical protein